MTPEQYFFNYAFPCAQVLLDQHKIDSAAYNELRRMFYAGKAPSKKDLEQIFVSAFRRIKIIADQMNKDIWNMEVLKKYFRQEHNCFIDQNEGEYANFGEEFKSICKVYTAKIIDKQNDILTIKYGNTTRKVLGTIVPNAKKGDKVTVHLGFAVEFL